MAKVINLKAYRDQALDQRIFGPWTQRFGERYSQALTLPELSAKALFALALPGDPGTLAYYELIMGVLDLGPADHFHFMDNDHRMRVVDTHLFLADQVRFELMYRLGWITRFGGRELPLVQMVLDLGEAKNRVRQQPPQLAASHPEYAHYQKLVYGDKEAFLRRMLPEALETFQKQL